MKFKFRANDGVWFSPKIDFLSEWAAWLYIKDLYGDAEISNFRMEEVYPELLQDQAL